MFPLSLLIIQEIDLIKLLHNFLHILVQGEVFFLATVAGTVRKFIRMTVTALCERIQISLSCLGVYRGKVLTP